MRDGDEVDVLSVSDLDDDQRAELRAAVGALVGLGAAVGEGAVAGAELGASIDPDAPTRPRWSRQASWTSSPTARRRWCWPSSTSGPCPCATRSAMPGGLVLAARSLTVEDLVVLGMDIGGHYSRRPTPMPTPDQDKTD